MAVPVYYRSKHGHVFRLQRSRSELADGAARFVLRAIPIRANAGQGPGEETGAPLEVVQETRLEDVRDRIQRRHMVATPEQTFDQLWQRLRIDLEAT